MPVDDHIVDWDFGHCSKLAWMLRQRLLQSGHHRCARYDFYTLDMSDWNAPFIVITIDLFIESTAFAVPSCMELMINTLVSISHALNSGDQQAFIGNTMRFSVNSMEPNLYPSMDF